MKFSAPAIITFRTRSLTNQSACISIITAEIMHKLVHHFWKLKFNVDHTFVDFDKQIGGLQQKVDEMDITQRDLVAEYEEHVMHLKQEVGECQGHLCSQPEGSWCVCDHPYLT